MTKLSVLFEREGFNWGPVKCTLGSGKRYIYVLYCML